jgi:dipeptidyl aminopeptidase/acylaminoacyl peptidase
MQSPERIVGIGAAQIMGRDIRQTPLYKEVEEFFRRAHEPAFGKTSGAMSPAVSPDGRTIAFAGTRLEKLEGRPLSRICLVNAEGGARQEITAGPKSDVLPRWSPDGKRLAFLSDRVEEEQFQLYLLEAGRLGEAIATPSLDGTVEYLAWSPDGRKIALGVAGRGADVSGGQDRAPRRRMARSCPPGCRPSTRE